MASGGSHCRQALFMGFLCAASRCCSRALTGRCSSWSLARRVSALASDRSFTRSRSPPGSTRSAASRWVVDLWGRPRDTGVAGARAARHRGVWLAGGLCRGRRDNVRAVLFDDRDLRARAARLCRAHAGSARLSGGWPTAIRHFAEGRLRDAAILAARHHLFSSKGRPATASSAAISCPCSPIAATRRRPRRLSSVHPVSPR